MHIRVAPQAYIWNVTLLWNAAIYYVWIVNLTFLGDQTDILAQPFQWNCWTTSMELFNETNGIDEQNQWIRFQKMAVWMGATGELTNRNWRGIQWMDRNYYNYSNWYMNKCCLYIEHRDTETLRACAKRKRLCASESLCSNQSFKICLISYLQVLCSKELEL